MASVIPPDLELFLTGWLRSNITDIPGLQVGNRIPDGYGGSYPLVVVRDDGGHAIRRPRDVRQVDRRQRARMDAQRYETMP